MKQKPELVAAILSLLLLQCQASGQASIGLNEILGRPTATSVTVSALFDQQVQVYFQFGISPGVYAITTATRTSVIGEPMVMAFESLQANTRYYYRTCYKRPADPAYVLGTEHTFHTQRAPGSTYAFTIEADPHPYDKKGSHTLWPITMKNQLADSADFLVDLGDTFGDDHNPLTITSNETRQLHLDCRAYFGLACHSSPLILCLGNHEGESGYYLLQTPPSNLGVYGTLWRKFYYPNPAPDGFYSGNTTVEGFGIGVPENYFAWEWGDALFVVLDAYRYYTASAKPRGWDWSLGKSQYDWFKQTLESSKAKFRFVFTHHTLGETRGGAITAKLYEWGGYEADGRTWGFSANRPGWGMPIHQLMVANGVNIFFQGHDHLYAREDVDGIVYQEVPMPSDSTYIIGVRDNGDAYTDVKIDGSGHVRVTVSSSEVKVDYVRAWLPADETAGHANREVAHTYTVSPKVTSGEVGRASPVGFALEQNFPNPFNPSTTIGFLVSGPGSRDPQPGSHTVKLGVYDVLGREVALLVNGPREAGRHVVSWNASSVPSGVYYYRLHVDGSAETRKAVVLK
jgi:hypothetical protein